MSHCLRCGELLLVLAAIAVLAVECLAILLLCHASSRYIWRHFIRLDLLKLNELILLL